LTSKQQNATIPALQKAGKKNSIFNVATGIDETTSLREFCRFSAPGSVLQLAEEYQCNI